MAGFPLLRPSHNPLQPLSTPAAHSRSSNLPLPRPCPPPRPLPAFHTNPSMIPAQTSAKPIGPKQVMDPLAGFAPTSATNYSSSGSSHDPTSACLVEMVHEFLEEEGPVGSCGRTRCNCLNGTCSGEARCSSEADDSQLPVEQLSEILEGLVTYANSDEPMLFADVTKVTKVEMGKCSDASQKEYGNVGARCCLRRPVMRHLRQLGYNAAICKTRWNHTDGIPAGDYEFIDVLIGRGPDEKRDRYIVDIDFKAQFEIARASKEYCALLEILPIIFVGRVDTIKQILKTMSSAAKRSIKEQNLLLPPWRKHRYMYAKWFSSYKRTTNDESLKSKRSDPLEFLTLRTPRFCLEFTKEMHMFHFRSQFQGDRKLESLEVAGSREAARRAAAGFDNNLSKQWIEGPREICSITSTDWQLPPPKKAEKREGLCRDRSSALANALKEVDIRSATPLPKRLEKTESFIREQQMLITVS